MSGKCTCKAEIHNIPVVDETWSVQSQWQTSYIRRLIQVFQTFLISFNMQNRMTHITAADMHLHNNIRSQNSTRRQTSRISVVYNRPHRFKLRKSKVVHTKLLRRMSSYKLLRTRNLTVRILYHSFICSIIKIQAQHRSLPCNELRNWQWKATNAITSYHTNNELSFLYSHSTSKFIKTTEKLATLKTWHGNAVWHAVYRKSTMLARRLSASQHNHRTCHHKLLTAIKFNPGKQYP